MNNNPNKRPVSNSGNPPLNNEELMRRREMMKRELIKRELIRREKLKRERIRKQKRADKNCLIIVAVLFLLVTALNLFQFNRPTESEVEKRKLAEFPSFSVKSLMSGDFTEGINKFFADTFVWRDSIVLFSKKLDSLSGYDFSVDGNGSFVVIDTGKDKEEEDDSLGDILDSLEKGDDDTSDTDTSSGDESSNDKQTLKLNKASLTLTVGGGAALIAENTGDDAQFKWSVKDSSVVELTFDGGTAKLKAMAAGETVVTCKSGEESVQCKVKVESITSSGEDAGSTADFMTNGLFIYGDAVYTQGWYSEQYSAAYSRTLAYYKTIFPNARVSACIIPTSAIRIDNEEIKSKLPDQKQIFDRLSEIMDPSVNFVNTYAEMYAHRGEYIYFKSDHHWTQRGAYYAYKAFVESVGLEAAKLEDFDVKILTESYSGSMYEYTKDERVKTFKDTIEAFMSRKKLTMTITDRSNKVTTYDKAIMEWSDTYGAFLCSDNPYTVINVPENPQDRNILVIKDSYGNAFVPFLAENYGNIMVVDTRYTSMNVREMFADYELTDILFINNLEAANSPAWAKMYLRAAGVSVD